MDPLTLAALGLAAGAGKGGGSTKTTQQTSVSNNVGISSPVTATFGLSLGGNLPQTVSPVSAAPITSTTSPSLSASDAASGSGSYLPRTSPTGAIGTGSGFAAPPSLISGNDDLLLLLMIGVGAYVLMQD